MPFLNEKKRDEYNKYLERKKKEEKQSKKRPKKKVYTKKQKQKHKEKYHRYLKSDAWKKIKIQVFTERGLECEKCYSTKGLQIHHKHYRNIFNEKLEDLILLCSECHQKEHDKPKKKRKKRV
jgi:5-methylcytosine-specific restriction endonuclease McrA